MTEETAIRQFLEQNFLFSGRQTIRDQDSFLENGVLDSTGVLELVGFLERTFSVAVADEEMTPDNLDSITRVADYVRRKRGAPAGVARDAQS